jgi:hypothetical protein
LDIPNLLLSLHKQNDITMAKATKTWKIGEYAKGGIITVEITGKVIAIIGKEWDTSTGYNKSSDQSNAKEFTRGTVTADDSEAYRKMYFFLTDLTTSYYADNILKWIETKVKLNNTF